MPDELDSVSIQNELAARLKNGDRQAFTSIYWSYHSAVYYNILRLTKDITASEDLVQEVFITLWEKRLQLDTARSLPGWLFTVSYHKSVNYLKTKVGLAELTDLQDDDTADSYHEAFHEEQVQTLEKAIEQLSPQKKRVFELCKLQRKTYEEAALEMNLSKHTVKEYLSGAMVSVTEYVKEHAEPSGVFAVLIFLQGLY